MNADSKPSKKLSPRSLDDIKDELEAARAEVFQAAALLKAIRDAEPAPGAAFPWAVQASAAKDAMSDYESAISWYVALNYEFRESSTRR